MTDGFDITKAAEAANVEDEGQQVRVTDIEGEPMFYGDPKRPVTITVAGTYSKVYRAAMNRQRRKMAKRRGKLTGELIEEQQLDLAAACVMAWEGFTADGKPVECTRDNVTAVFRAAPWVREQVEEAMNDHEGFSKSNSTI